MKLPVRERFAKSMRDADHRNNARLAAVCVNALQGLRRMARPAAWVMVLGVISSATAQTPPIEHAVGGWQETVAEVPPPVLSDSEPALPDGLPTESAAKAIGDAGQEPHDEDAKKKQAEKKAALTKSVAGAFKGVFYENDFQYLTDPNYQTWHFGEGLKRLPLGCGSLLDLGGQYRWRLHEEHNFRGLGLTGRDDDFLLHRTRLFANWQINDGMRVYAEYLDAASQGEEFAPRPIEENRSDMLNLFFESTLVSHDAGKLLVRAGRQELLIGDERMISPLDWANTRRTFDGSRLTWKTKKHQSDLFWVMPLITNPSQFDAPQRNQQFYGLHHTYKPSETTTWDSFYLAFDDDTVGSRIDSFGGRWYHEQGQALIELWGNYQFGSNADDSAHNAGAWTIGLGRKLGGPGNARLWCYYDWASGDNELGTGNGHFHFFPLAHKYLGFMDFFGRRNIETANVLFTVSPTKKLQLLVWYYYFFLQDRRDTPYSVVMTPFAPGVTPGSASLGHELDLMATYNLSARTSMLAGYSRFFPGAYYNTPGLPYSGDADFFFLQYQFNF